MKTRFLAVLAFVAVFAFGCTGMPTAGGSGLGLRSNGNITINIEQDGGGQPNTAAVTISGNAISQDAEKTVDAAKLAANPAITGQGTASTTGAADVGGQSNAPVDTSLIDKVKADAAAIEAYRKRLEATPGPLPPVAVDREDRSIKPGPEDPPPPALAGEGVEL